MVDSKINGQNAGQIFSENNPQIKGEVAQNPPPSNPELFIPNGEIAQTPPPKQDD